MKKQEYTLEEISYSRKEDRRIMERVLNGWFKDPKALNFTAPGFSFPFKFKKWRSIFYNPNINQSATVVLKNNGWIIGHISLRLEDRKAYIFNLFIDSNNRRNGLGIKMMNEIENYGKSIGAMEYNLNITPKNIAAKNLFEKLNYIESSLKSSPLIKMIKRVK